MNKILLIQTAFIGDAILATDLLEELHAHFPSAQIDLLVRKGNESLFTEHPFLNQVLEWNKKEKKYKHLFQLSKQIRAAHYDLVLNLQRFAASGFITWRSKANYRIGFDKNPFAFGYTTKVKHEIGNGQHEVERNRSLLDGLTPDSNAVSRTRSAPCLYPSQSDYDKVAQYTTSEFVCFAPTSVWFTKQFPKERWVELANLIPKETRIYIIGGPADADTGNYIIKHTVHPKIKILAGKLSLLQSAALMKSAKMNYVNDSAPQHLASSMNAPVTTFYCSTVPEFGFGPLSDDSTVLQESTDLDCRPCGLHGHKACPKGHFKCAMGIQLAIGE